MGEQVKSNQSTDLTVHVTFLVLRSKDKKVGLPLSGHALGGDKWSIINIKPKVYVIGLLSRNRVLAI